MKGRRRKILSVLTAGLWAVLLSTSLAAPGDQQQPGPDGIRERKLPVRPKAINGSPFTTMRVHDINNLRFSITNWGLFGSLNGYLIDPQTNMPAPGAYFPAGTNFEHLRFGAIWIGAVRGSDTLVSTAYDGMESLTEYYPPAIFEGGRIIERSNRRDSRYYHPEAYSEQDFICSYSDTLTAQEYVPPDHWSWRPHKPIPVRIRQESFAWPYEYADDFVIIRYWIANPSVEDLDEVWVGFLVDPEVRHYKNLPSAWDDHVGYRDTVSSIMGHGFSDTVRISWFADNGGDPVGRQYFDQTSIRSAGGISIIGTPVEIYRTDWPWSEWDCWQYGWWYSYNWWMPSSNTVYDWGPQHTPTDASWSGGYGEPLGDRQKFRYLANGEIDYDQIWANEDFSAEGWIGPPFRDTYYPANLARGYNTTSLLSVGPFEIEAGDSIPVVLAFALGEGFHHIAKNVGNIPYRQEVYYENLDFTDLGRNVQWAKWVYDNPGKDTDGDGCRGKYFLVRCRDTIFTWNDWEWHDKVCDTIFYAGDGIPDLKGPPPPPSPQISITSEPQKIHLTWTGRLSETSYDDFSGRTDFEGYNVYSGLGYNPNSLALIASWDYVNFDRYRYDPKARPSLWVNQERPFTLHELTSMYGDHFDPRQHHDQFSYLVDEEGRRFYFEPHGGNRGNEYVDNGEIVKNLIQMVNIDSSWNESSQSWQLFGNYECTIEGLLPSQSYYFAVTAFDHGFPEGGLGPLESSTQTNMQLAYPSYSPEHVVEKKLDVVVYPNPYKISGQYRARGFEDPNREGFLERERRIHFVNLPPRATIKIFSLDGDLIREIEHPHHILSDSPSHTAWDLITRNTQAAVSGIYLYSVVSDGGTQIGKIVIIK